MKAFVVLALMVAVAFMPFLYCSITTQALSGSHRAPNKELRALFDMGVSPTRMINRTSSDLHSSSSPSSMNSVSTNLNSEIIVPEQSQRHQQPPSLCLVHVGKTAGGTLTCRLMGSKRNRPRSQCKDFDGGIISNYVVGKLHKYESESFMGRSCNDDYGKNGNNIKRTDKNTESSLQSPSTSNSDMIFLVTIRDPLSRMKSWFDYENPRSKRVDEITGNRPYLYEDICQFDSIQQISQSLQIAIEGIPESETTTASNATQTKMVCAKRAWMAVTGQVGFQYHNTYNYNYYNQWINSILQFKTDSSKNQSKQRHHKLKGQRRIMVVRSEYLQDDWNSIERYYEQIQSHHGNGHERRVGGTPFFESIQMNSGNSTTATSHSASNNNPYQTYLCVALCQELIVYKQFIHEAINLTPIEKNHSLSTLDVEICPNVMMVQQHQCPVLHPTIQSQKDPSRQKYKKRKLMGFKT